MVSMPARVLTSTAPHPVDVTAVCEHEGRFMWASLHRLGVPQADLPDALQDALVVVHRRANSFDGSCQLRTWLFAICVKVAAAHRRRAHVRREEPRAAVELVEPRNPEHEAVVSAARARLRQLLDTLAPEQRAVLVMFEIEGLSCAEIAAELGTPVGTVHSRLHAARRAFRASLERLQARERHLLQRHARRGAP